ncbi:hypothetical protein [Cardiobacterium valvarum]|uniref:Uncharacterized protein n=1 Tax=Cardiobacterium valvarum F0432 TaxID=797473 RepID=G9ZG84_9GAMM|nr:hypothetical protein [Cardiobacterium valvarum]EHM53366.1 hypothetical protein HMPREF9080_01787 [Cardiobacterium valvarum F0432]
MTVSNTPRRAWPYRGDGSTVDYPFAFRIFDTADLRVYVADTNGNERELATGEYTVTADIKAQPNAPGGSIRLRTPLPAGHLLSIITRMEYIQPAEFTNSGGFYPRVLNDSLDRQTIYVQQLAEIQSRSIGGAVNGGSNLRLPVGAPKRTLMWDETGKQLTNSSFDIENYAETTRRNAEAAITDIRNTVTGIDTHVRAEITSFRAALSALKGGNEALALNRRLTSLENSVNATLRDITQSQQAQNAALKKIKILALAGL